jgi:hypothetical protein
MLLLRRATLKALAIDPGGTTGIAQYERREGTPVGAVETFDAWSEGNPFAAIDRARLEVMEGLDVMIVERFTITGATARKTRGGSNQAIEIIGTLRWLAHNAGVPFVEQQPAEAKGFCTDSKLKLIGWYTPGVDHARDATRHLLLWLVKNGEVNTRRVIQ